MAEVEADRDTGSMARVQAGSETGRWGHCSQRQRQDGSGTGRMARLQLDGYGRQGIRQDGRGRGV